MFKYLIVIEPLGFLYGSAGRFLSPENLVGRSGTAFPPSAATLSGLFAACYQGDKTKLDNLQLAGPFYAKNDTKESLNNFYVPTPFHCLVEDNKIEYQMSWHKEQNPETSQLQDKWCVWNKDKKQCESPPVGKFSRGTWIKIQNWDESNWVGKTVVDKVPWKFIPQLHPRLEDEQRRVLVEKKRDKGTLFLENAVQLDSDYALVYLSNTELKEDWYRFGGEGHLVAIRNVEILGKTKATLTQPIQKSFALITPAIWGSNRLSYREPMLPKNNGKDKDWIPAWQSETTSTGFQALLTERPFPSRYRLGNPKESDTENSSLRHSKTKLLSRGRYAVPAGTVYVLDKPLKYVLDKPHPTWQDFPEEWFPREAYSFKRWGCGLALPLDTDPPDCQEKQ